MRQAFIRPPEDPFTLSEGEKHSPLWAKLVEYLQEKIDIAHGKLEGEISEQKTAQYRGQITVLRALIALGADESPQDDE